MKDSGSVSSAGAAAGSGSGSSAGGGGCRTRDLRDDRDEGGGEGASVLAPSSRGLRAGRVVAMNSRRRGAVRIASKTRGDTELALPAMIRITGPVVLPGCSREEVEALRLISVAWLSMLTMLTSPKPFTTSATTPRGEGRFVRPTPATRGERFIAALLGEAEAAWYRYGSRARYSSSIRM